MADFSTQSDLVVNTVRDLNDLRTATYNLATQSLEDLKTALVDLPLTVVDTDIGASLDIDWTAVIPSAPTVTEPTYPTYSEPTVPTIDGIIQPAEVVVGTAPTWNVAIDSVPDAPTIVWPDAPTLDALPTIDTVIPTITVDELEATFSFNNPTYTPEMTTLKADIAAVLGGDLGLPSTYWSAIWTRVADDLARLQVAKLRRIRNSGAASWWSLPSEAILSQSREVADETTRAIQLDKLEKAVQEAVFAREDFWKAVDAAIRYEQIFVDIHNEAARRTLEAAKESVNSLIAVYNANLAGFTFILEKAKAEIEIDKITYEALTAKYQAQAQVYATNIDKYRGQIDLYNSEINGYKIEKELLIQNLGEQVKYWNGVVDQDVKYKELAKQANELEVRAYDSEVQGFVGMYNAANSLLDARIKAAKYPAEYAQIEAQLDQAKNQIEVAKGELIVRSQEAAARIDVAQEQWAQTNYIENLKSVAEFNYSYAQAVATASDVSLSSGVDISESYNYSGEA
jgi:PP-loop superfamily ATP-utilizing enzyme